MAHSPFRILAICTGNICRSPAVDLLLAGELAGAATGPSETKQTRAARFAVSSAGTHAMAGWPISPPMGTLLAERGIESDDFVARQATRAMLAESDLILTATREHREWVFSHDPRSVRRAFTLTEFADAVRGHPDSASATAAELVAWAASNRPSPGVTSRGAVTRRGYAEGDILDPYGRGDAAFIAALTQIEPLAAFIATALRSTR
ncbi:hypothetical protein [Leifsonia poae]|uniref:arsenate reductase/protein-tyrosine-phosphatase family protein n=1 Tax=Leifsonia poae TaxID=110933 RepID=UPI003D67FB16